MDHPIAQTLKKFSKPINYILGLGIIGLGSFLYIRNVTYSSLSLFYWVEPAYFILFGLMMIASDLKLNVVLENCKFLDMYMGRGLFNIYVSSLLWYNASLYNMLTSPEPIPILSQVASIVLVVYGIFFIFLHCAGGSKTISGEGESATTSNA